MAGDNKEEWTMQTNGRVWVEITVDASKGSTKHVNVKGKGARLKISTEDRQWAQERTRDKKDDVFTNGILCRTDADQQADPETASPSAVDDASLKKLLALRPITKFTAAIDELSEVSLRRVMKMIPEDDNVTSAMEKRVQDTFNTKFSVNKNTDPAEALLSTEELRAKREAGFPEQKLTS